MKGLLIRPPWIDMILSRQKTWEMRASDTSHRGVFLLIQSGSGLIVGQANLVGTQKLEPAQFEQTKCYHCVDDLSLLNRWCYAWILEDIQRFDFPIPYTHPQGAVIWVKLPSLGGLHTR